MKVVNSIVPHHHHHHQININNFNKLNKFLLKYKEAAEEGNKKQQQHCCIDDDDDDEKEITIAIAITNMTPKVQPVFAYVTQGRTEHMVTITDKNVLEMLQTQPKGWDLSNLPEDSKIQIKWNNTGAKQSVIVSSVKLMDLDNEDRFSGGGRSRSRSRRGSATTTQAAPVSSPAPPKKKIKKATPTKKKAATTTTIKTETPSSDSVDATTAAAAAIPPPSVKQEDVVVTKKEEQQQQVQQKQQQYISVAAEAAEAEVEAKKQRFEAAKAKNKADKDKAKAKQEQHKAVEEEEQAAAAAAATTAATALALEERRKLVRDAAATAEKEQHQQQADAAAAAAAQEEETKKKEEADADIAAEEQKRQDHERVIEEASEEEGMEWTAESDAHAKTQKDDEEQHEREKDAAGIGFAANAAAKLKSMKEELQKTKRLEEEKRSAEEEAAADVVTQKRIKAEARAEKERIWFEQEAKATEIQKQQQVIADEEAKQRKKKNEEKLRKERLLAEVRAKAEAKAEEEKQRNAIAAAAAAAAEEQQEKEEERKRNAAIADAAYNAAFNNDAFNNTNNNNNVKEEDKASVGGSPNNNGDDDDDDDGMYDTDAYASEDDDDNNTGGGANNSRPQDPRKLPSIPRKSLPQKNGTGSLIAHAQDGNGNGNGGEQPPSKRVKTTDGGGGGGSSSPHNGNGEYPSNNGGGASRNGNNSDGQQFNSLLGNGNFEEAGRLAEGDDGKRRTDDISFLYGYVVIDYLKYKLGYLPSKEMDVTLIKALQCNPFVPPYLMMIRRGDALPPMRASNDYEIGERSEALHYIHGAKEIWRRIPGLLSWIDQTSNRGGSSKPQDDGFALFNLLSKGSVLVDVETTTSSGSSTNIAESASTPTPSDSADGETNNSNGLAKLFVGGLPQDISEPEFREFFAQFGELQDATVKFDQNTGLPRGFGFVTYIDPEIATFVTKLGDKREGYGRLVMRGKTCEIKAHKENRNKLFVGGLPMDITNNELRDFFQQFGTVVDSIVMVHKENNVPRGFGFVTFAEPDVTDFVLQMRDNNYGSNRDGIGRIVMRGKVCEIKVYNSKEGHPPLPSSSSQKRLRDNDDNFSGGGPKTMKVTTNVHDMKERLPQDFNLPLAIKEYTSSTDIVCFSDDKETSFPYSAVRKVYFWKLLSGSGYYCHEMEQEKKEGGGDQGYRRREHRDQNYDDPMMVTGVGGGNDVVTGALSCPICGGPHRKEKCWDDPKNGHLRPPGWVSRKGINLGNTHDEQHQSMKPHQIGGDHHGRGAVVPYTCPICGGAHRKEKCWDDPKNAHLRPADWMPSATFLSRKGIHAGRPSHTQGGSHNDDQSVRSGGGSGGGSGYVVMCSICKGPHKTEKCWDDPKNAKFRPSTDWRSKEEVKERLHDRDHPGENNHGPFKWRAPEAGENNKRIIDHKPHTYNFSIKGWVDDSVRGKDKWRAPEAGENDRRVIDKKPHNYNYNIKGWVIDPAFARAGGAGPDFNDNRRGSSYGDDPRRNSYGGGGTGTTDRYRDESGGGGDDYRRSSYGGGVVGKPSSGDVSSPAGRYREESDNYGGDDRRGSSYRGGSSPAGRYRDDDSYDGDRRYNGGGGGGGDTSPSGRYRDELDRYRG